MSTHKVILTEAVTLSLCLAMLLFCGCAGRQSAPSQPSLDAPVALSAPQGATGVVLSVQKYTRPWLDNRPLLTRREDCSLATPEDAELAFQSAVTAQSPDWIQDVVTGYTWGVMKNGPHLTQEKPPGPKDSRAHSKYFYRANVQTGQEEVCLLYFKLINASDPLCPKEDEQSYSVFVYKKEGPHWKRCFEWQKTALFDMLRQMDPGAMLKTE